MNRVATIPTLKPSLAFSLAKLTSGRRFYKKILQHSGLWEESHAPPERDPPIKEITFDPFYSLIQG
jgi:hypothetical protein